MKKYLFITLAAFFFGLSSASADGLDRDRIITKEQLPASAIEFINKNFANNKISFVKEDRELFSKNYEVVFSDGIRLEFTRNGEWKEVDCRNYEVPANIVPAAIAKYVSDNYSVVRILQIDSDRYDYEVRLSNNLELTFDKSFNIIDIDD